MPAVSTDSLEGMGLAELVGLVRDLIGEVGRFRAKCEALEGDVARLNGENRSLKDEIARLKGLPPRPPQRPSGMEAGTGPSPAGDKPGPGRRGGQLDKLKIDRTVEVKADAPPGSRRK